jgi:hypothetical protein
MNEGPKLLVCADDNLLRENMKTATSYDINKQVQMTYETMF